MNHHYYELLQEAKEVFENAILNDYDVDASKEGLRIVNELLADNTEDNEL